MAGNCRGREPSLLGKRSARQRDALPAFTVPKNATSSPPPDLVCRTGNRRGCDCRSALSNLPATLLFQLSYSLAAGGTRTRDTRLIKRSNTPLHHHSTFDERGTGETATAAKTPKDQRGHMLYQLSYSPAAGGIRTRDPVLSEVTVLFTTARQSGCRGTGETETTPVAQGHLLSEKARSPRRDAHCGGRLHGTKRMPGSPR